MQSSGLLKREGLKSVGETYDATTIASCVPNKLFIVQSSSLGQ